MPPWDNTPAGYATRKNNLGGVREFTRSVDRARYHNGLSRIDRTPVHRKCLGPCGREFDTYKDGPRLCPSCEKRRV